MEPRFGADFSQVRVHTGNEAVQMKALGKYAVTFGAKFTPPDAIQQDVEDIKKPQVAPVANNPQVPALNNTQPNQAIVPDNQAPVVDNTQPSQAIVPSNQGLDGNNSPASTEVDDYNNT
jgi:Domain of unknown function (DUF4157)